MFVVNEFVAITGGSWRGRRGLVRAIGPGGLDGQSPRWLLVTIERQSAPGMHWGRPGTVSTFAEHYVAPEHCEHLS